MGNARKSRPAAFCLVVFGSLMSQAAATVPPAPTGTTETCPAPSMRPPLYPVEMMRRGKGGTVVLDLGVDPCGRVQQAGVKQSSGYPQLDSAAVEAARQWILGAADLAKVVNGRLERPVSFGMSPDQSIPYAKLNWPKSHKRPQYRLESMVDFGSAKAARDAIRVPVEKTIKPPYGIQSQFFRYGDGDVPEYWLFLYKGRQANLAARYRLIQEAGEPTVMLSIACDDQPEACAKASEFLSKGLPFARAK